MTRILAVAVACLALGGCVTVDSGFDERCQKYLAAAELGFNLAGTFVNFGPEAKTMEQRIAAAVRAGCVPPSVAAPVKRARVKVK